MPEEWLDPCDSDDTLYGVARTDVELASTAHTEFIERNSGKDEDMGFRWHWNGSALGARMQFRTLIN